MNILPLRDHRFNGNGIEFTIRALANENLRAIGEEFWRAALVGFHMRDLRANDRVIALTKRRQRKRIRGRAVENKEDLAFRLEHFANQISRPRRKNIIAIT